MLRKHCSTLQKKKPKKHSLYYCAMNPNENVFPSVSRSAPKLIINNNLTFHCQVEPIFNPKTALLFTSILWVYAYCLPNGLFYKSNNNRYFILKLYNEISQTKFNFRYIIFSNILNHIHFLQYQHSSFISHLSFLSNYIPWLKIVTAVYTKIYPCFLTPQYLHICLSITIILLTRKIGTCVFQEVPIVTQVVL